MLRLLLLWILLLLLLSLLYLQRLLLLLLLLQFRHQPSFFKNLHQADAPRMQRFSAGSTQGAEDLDGGVTATCGEIKINHLAAAEACFS